MIPESEVEKCLDWMRDNAEPAARASAEVIRAEEFLKTTLAMVASNSTQTTIAGHEREARASKAFQKAIEERVIAVYQDRKFRLLYSAAEVKVEVWRSEQASNRTLGNFK